MENAVVILAAGMGSRMKSDLPKVLHQIAGAPMLHHAMQSAAAIEAARTIVVTGHGAEMVQKSALAYDADAVCVLQSEQNGTAHAVDMARDALSDFDGDVLVLFGDTPFVSVETLGKILAARADGADVVNLGFRAADPGRYGRLITDKDGALTAIVEAKDATPEQLKIDFCNSGVLCADRKTLFDMIAKIDSENASGEYYLTDVIAHANAAGLKCVAVECNEAETLGVNSRADLAAAEAVFQENARAAAMENGTTLTDPATVWFGFDTHIGRDVVIDQNVVIAAGVTVETGAHIRAFSHLEGCHVGKGAVVGPYARLRPGTELGNDCKIGNFVETKNAVFDDGAKANHLSYVGDSTVGAAANIGAGTITCNYDGVFKHKTQIGEKAFIGSNSSLVAPVSIGKGAMTGSGSVITEDVADGAMALGRARQVNKAGLAQRLMDKLRAMKAAQKSS